MASTSSSSAAESSAAQHIDVDVEDETRDSLEALDEDMAGAATQAADAEHSPQSTHTTEPHDDSGPATPFYQSNSANRQQSGSRTADAAPDEDDDMMDPILPGVEGRFLDEKIRARYIQEIGDIF